VGPRLSDSVRRRGTSMGQNASCGRPVGVFTSSPLSPSRRQETPKRLANRAAAIPLPEPAKQAQPRCRRSLSSAVRARSSPLAACHAGSRGFKSSCSRMKRDRRTVAGAQPLWNARGTQRRQPVVNAGKAGTGKTRATSEQRRPARARANHGAELSRRRSRVRVPSLP
jgi:hypothetical protein